MTRRRSTARYRAPLCAVLPVLKTAVSPRSVPVGEDAGRAGRGRWTLVPWRGSGLRPLLRSGLRVASVIAVMWVSIAAAVEYQINFTDGTELRTSRVRQVGDAIQYEKFGGEASVAVDEVASVYVIEADGDVSWVMQPRREGSQTNRVS